MQLRELAHAQTGDKGHISNISLSAYLALDAHGKSLSSALLALELPEPAEWNALLSRHAGAGDALRS